MKRPAAHNQLFLGRRASIKPNLRQYRMARLRDDFRILGISQIGTEVPQFNQFLAPSVLGPAEVLKTLRTISTPATGHP
jgi:hypothetical protein